MTLSSVPRLTILVSALAVCAGCVTPMRASNFSFAPKDAASARFPGNVDQAQIWLSTNLETKGLASRLQYGKAPDTVYVFQGVRGDLPGQVYWGRKGRAPMVGSTLDVGSIVYAYLKPTEDGTATYMTLFGKPTVGGHQLCADGDSNWNLPCEDVEAGPNWSGRAELNGSAEAKLIRDLLASLPTSASNTVASKVIATFQPPTTLQQPNAGFADCDYTYATGSHFHTNYCPGGDKSISQEAMERAILEHQENKINRPE